MKIEVDPKIFRAYDIRGLYPSEINEKIAFLIGRAFVKFLKKGAQKREIIKIGIGRDNRISSPYLLRGLKRGILTERVKVFDFGLSTTPLFYFGISHLKLTGGIQITASHNPPQYNGFKIVKRGAFPVGEGSGLEEIKKLVFSEETLKRERKGISIKKKILKEYIDFNLKEFNLKDFLPLKIVVDTANSVSGILFPRLFEKTKIKIFHLFSELDGAFPNHPPDPLVKENLKVIRERVKKEKATLGVAFDGDGDRIIFIDEKGEIISGDLILAFLAKTILEKKPRQKIAYDIRSSNIVPETIKRYGGIPLVSRIGHSFIKQKMRKEDIVFGGELSGHYYSKNHYFCEAPILVLLKIIEKISQTKKPLSELIKPFKKYFHSGEINFKTEKKEEIIRELERRYKKGRVTKLDGIRIDFQDWWFLVRPSNTEPVLRLVVEAKEKRLLKEKIREVKKIIHSFL